MTEQFYPEDYFDENPDPQDKDPKEPGDGHIITILVLFVVLLSLALYIILLNLDK